MSTSTNKRRASGNNENDESRKAHRSAPDDELIQDPVLVPTGVDNVHQVAGDSTPSMESFKSQTSDWGDPVILVITRKTRDVFLQYLHKITNDSVINVIQRQDQRPTDEDTVPVFVDNNYSTQAVASINEFNKSTIDIIEQKAESTKKQLDNIQNRFTESELKRRLDNDEQFNKLKSIRKLITQFHVASSKALKAASLQTSTKKHYICQLEKNLIPNRFDKEVIDKIDKDIDAFASKINADLCTHMLSDTLNIIKKTQDLIRKEDELIIAKSWRSIKISQKRQFNTYRQHEDNDRYKPQRPSEYQERPRFEDRRGRPRPSYHDEQYCDDRDRESVASQSYYRQDRKTNQFQDNARSRYRNQNNRNEDDYDEGRRHYKDRYFDRHHDSYRRQHYRNDRDYRDERDRYKDRHYDGRRDSYTYNRR